MTITKTYVVILWLSLLSGHDRSLPFCDRRLSTDWTRYRNSVTSRFQYHYLTHMTSIRFRAWPKPVECHDRSQNTGRVVRYLKALISKFKLAMSIRYRLGSSSTWIATCRSFHSDELTGQHRLDRIALGHICMICVCGQCRYTPVTVLRTR